jgi:hypothetical protein
MTTPEEIKELIEKITRTNLSVKSRKREIVDYRIVAFKLTRELTNLSLAAIGRLYNKDHATVLHGLKKFEVLKDQSQFKNSLRLYNRCFSILLDIPEPKKNNKTIKNKLVYIDELTPLQKLVTNLKPSEEKELIELITLRKKSWEWKSKDSLKVYQGSY